MIRLYIEILQNLHGSAFNLFFVPTGCKPSLHCFQEILPVRDKLLILLQILRINPLADFYLGTILLLTFMYL